MEKQGKMERMEIFNERRTNVGDEGEGGNGGVMEKEKLRKGSLRIT